MISVSASSYIVFHINQWWFRFDVFPVSTCSWKTWSDYYHYYYYYQRNNNIDYSHIIIYWTIAIIHLVYYSHMQLIKSLSNLFKWNYYYYVICDYWLKYIFVSTNWTCLMSVLQYVVIELFLLNFSEEVINYSF